MERRRVVVPAALENRMREPYTRITAHQTLSSLNLGKLWRYRDLLWALVHRNLVLRYRKSILGPLWLIIQPLALTLALLKTVGLIVGQSMHGQPIGLYYMTTLILWGYFSLVVPEISCVFVNNEYLFNKIYFPRLLVPISVLVTSAVGVALQIAVLGIVMAYLAIEHVASPNLRLLWLLPFAGSLLAMFALGLGLLIASGTAKYRDLLNAMSFLIQAWLFLTPVLYPLSKIPEHLRLPLAIVNPLSVVCDLWQAAFLGTLTSSPSAIVAATATICAVLLIAFLAFQRAEQTAADTI